MIPGLEHLSASSINLHLRCPRQWQERYIQGKREAGNSSLIIGSAVHAALESLFSEELNQDYYAIWDKAVDEAGDGITWKDKPETAFAVYMSHVYHYWETVGKYLRPLKAEQEIEVYVPGVDIPVIGFIDLECQDRIIDFKTTAYKQTSGMFSPVGKVNKEWKFQVGIYQLAVDKPGEVHVLTRAKTEPIIVPDGPNHNLSYGRIDQDQIKETILHQWNAMNYNYETYGADKPWPGNPSHEWAGKYCKAERCCAL